MRDDAITLALIEANGLQPDALEDNRAGRLTPDQAQVLQRQRSFMGLVLVLIALTCVASGAWDFLPGHENLLSLSQVLVIF